MIDVQVNDHDAMVNALRAWHTNNAAPPPNIGITANQANDQWDIRYGVYDVPSGQIRMKRNNFELTQVTGPNNQFVATTYNHDWPTDLNVATLSGALSNPNLTFDAKARSLIILITSEAARSMFVNSFVRFILDGHRDAEGYGLIQILTAQYAHTQEFVGGSINPGPTWQPLTYANHLAYEKYKRDVKKVKNYVDALVRLDTAIQGY